MESQEYLLRSLMFVPGHSESMLNKAVNFSADALLPDLEDSVQPSANKAIARRAIVKKIQSGAFAGFHVFPRINDRESGFLLEDVAALTVEGVTGFVYPKARTGQDIRFLATLLESIESEKNLPRGQFKIIPLIETAAAVLNAQDICRASRRVLGIGFGCEDFITDIGGRHDRDDYSLVTPRALIAMAARANGVLPIDTAHIDSHNIEYLEKDLCIARNLGFEGAFVLNPKELPHINRCFSPTEQEVAESKEILRLDAEARKDGKGVAMMSGKFIGPPLVATARRVLQRHELVVVRDSQLNSRRGTS
jgi:citrate lyase subunit beta/citryl-CoA lyase